MSPRPILFLLIFIYLAGGSLLNPVLGVLGYMLHYIVGAEKQWWHAPLNPLGIRYSFAFGIMIAAGIFLNRDKLRFRRFLEWQEIYALLFLFLIWGLYIFGPQTVNRYGLTDHAVIKMTKVIIFCLMMTHVVTKLKDVEKIFWIIIIGAFLLGLQAYSLPRSAFTAGRLDGRVGGSDFTDANALAIFMVASTIIVSVKFMQSPLKEKFFCSVSGLFILNTIVLCRSRGALLALAGAGISIFIASPFRLKKHLIWGSVLALAGMISLTDTAYIERMSSITKHAESIMEGEEASDRSAMMRIEAWRGGIQMFYDHPFGVGVGNFNQFIGNYSPTVTGLSPHSLYIQVVAELGIFGLLLLFLLFFNAAFMLLGIIRNSKYFPELERKKYQWSALGLGGVLVGYMTVGLTAHLMYSEAFWWYLTLPVCLQRAFENTQWELSMPDNSASES